MTLRPTPDKKRTGPSCTTTEPACVSPRIVPSFNVHSGSESAVICFIPGSSGRQKQKLEVQHKQRPATYHAGIFMLSDDAQVARTLREMSVRK